MTKTSDLRRRLDLLMETFDGTFAVKLAKLTPNERREYEQWHAECASLAKQHPGEQLYARMLDGEPTPELRPTLRSKLFKDPPRIPAGSTMEEAAEIYRQFASGH